MATFQVSTRVTQQRLAELSKQFIPGEVVELSWQEKMKIGQVNGTRAFQTPHFANDLQNEVYYLRNGARERIGYHYNYMMNFVLGLAEGDVDGDGDLDLIIALGYSEMQDRDPAKFQPHHYVLIETWGSPTDDMNLRAEKK